MDQAARAKKSPVKNKDGALRYSGARHSGDAIVCGVDGLCLRVESEARAEKDEEDESMH